MWALHTDSSPSTQYIQTHSDNCYQLTSEQVSTQTAVMCCITQICRPSRPVNRSINTLMYSIHFKSKNCSSSKMNVIFLFARRQCILVFCMGPVKGWNLALIASADIFQQEQITLSAVTFQHPKHTCNSVLDSLAHSVSLPFSLFLSSAHLN